VLEAFGGNIYIFHVVNVYSLQRRVRAIWVNTRKRSKWFRGEIIACWIPDWPLQD